MSTVEEIESAIRRLPPKEVASLREWFAHYDAEARDRQLEGDIASGRLDALADEALDDLKAGRCIKP